MDRTPMDKTRLAQGEKWLYDTMYEPGNEYPFTKDEFIAEFTRGRQFVKELIAAVEDAWRERDSIPWTKNELRVARELGTLQAKLFDAMDRAKRAEAEVERLKGLVRVVDAHGVELGEVDVVAILRENGTLRGVREAAEAFCNWVDKNVEEVGTSEQVIRMRRALDACKKGTA